ncbi:MAG: hypothetical protein JWN65_592 [Solirubrobacterales bacterium]|nr:hypothetical protein [Solirubrobacterales bacterium]
MVSVPLRGLTCVLADTSVFCNVLRVLPATVLIDLLDYMGAALAIATDVNREMNGLSHGPFPGLQGLKAVDLVGEYLRGPALALDTDLVAQVQPIVEHSGIFTSDPDKPHKNWGEVATVLLAARRGVPVLMDDREGRTFAKRRGVQAHPTRRLIVEMYVDGALSYQDGLAVWQAAQSKRADQGDYDLAIAATRATAA